MIATRSSRTGGAAPLNPAARQVVHLRGRSGLLLLSGSFVYGAEQVADFSARRLRVALDGVAVENLLIPVATTMCASGRPLNRSPAVFFSFMEAGRARVSAMGMDFEWNEGESVLVATHDAVQIQCLTKVSLLQVEVEHGLVRLADGPVRSLPRPLERTSLVDGHVAFLKAVMLLSADHAASSPHHLRQAIIDLQSAVADEALHVPTSSIGRDGLRGRLKRFIDDAYRDPDLSPQRVAAEFGVSLRQVHKVFNVDGQTIARYISERRVRSAARELRSSRQRLAVADLARRNGFRNPDTMNRAFQVRFGMSVSAYRERPSRALDGEPAAEQALSGPASCPPSRPESIIDRPA